MDPKKVAIITGSATGIGAACALRLANHGYHVVINCTTSLAEAEETAEACRETGVEALIVPADVADDGQSRLGGCIPFLFISYTHDQGKSS